MSTSPTATSPSRCLGSCTSVPTGATAGVPDKSGAVTFVTPSGNIGCDMVVASDGSFAGCAILKADYTFPTPPHNQLDCVGLGLSTGKADVMCRGDVMAWELDQQAGHVDTLAYGSTVTDGPYVCHSDVTELSCWRTSTGHGFALSRQAYSVW